MKEKIHREKKGCVNLKCSIQEIWSSQGWNLTFWRLLNDWEITWVIELLNLLGEFPGTNMEKDKIDMGITCCEWDHGDLKTSMFILLPIEGLWVTRMTQRSSEFGASGKTNHWIAKEDDT